MLRHPWWTYAVAAALCGASACSDDASEKSAELDASVAPSEATYDFSALDKYAFDGKWKTEGLLVQHEGKLVYERYGAGFDKDMRHIPYSVSKSVGSALLGVAISEGRIALSDSICKHITVPEGADPTLCDTTVEHVLQMRSGLEWAETYESSPEQSNVIPMLYGDEPDMGAYVASRPRAHAAGTQFNYSSGDANLLSLAVRGSLGGMDMTDWAKAAFFDKVGMKGVLFERDAAGSLLFSSACFMTPRDMLRFGQLYLGNGVIDGKRVLPESWVKYTQTPSPANTTGIGSYGAAFWLNATSEKAPSKEWSEPSGTVKTYSARGHWGQYIFIVPEHDLVIVRTGNDRDPSFDTDPMLEHAIAAVKNRSTP